MSLNRQLNVNRQLTLVQSVLRSQRDASTFIAQHKTAAPNVTQDWIRSTVLRLF